MLKFETQYKNGLKDGIHKNYSDDGLFDSFIIYDNGEVDLNCFSKSYMLSYLEKKLKKTSIIQNKHQLVEIIENEVGTNKLFFDLKKTLLASDSKSKKNTLSLKIISKLSLDEKNDNWSDYKDWESLLGTVSKYDTIALKKFKDEINIDKLINNFSNKYVLAKSFEINNENSTNLDESLERVERITTYVRSLVWMAELCNVTGNNKEALKALNLSKKYSELSYSVNLISLIEAAHLDYFFQSIQILIKGFINFDKHNISLDIIRKISNKFSVVINGGKTKWEDWDQRKPYYGDAQFELYRTYVNSCKILWNNGNNKSLNNVYELLKNKYWLQEIKSELLLIQKDGVDPNEKTLLTEIVALNLEIEKEYLIQSFAVISNFNCYVEYADKLISKNLNDDAFIYLKKAKKIKEKYDDEFQLSIRKYNKISDADEFWYEKEKTIIPKLEKFYLNRTKIESTANVVAEIISKERRNFFDELSGNLVKREWKNKRWLENNCYDLISKIYFQNNELDKSFTYSLKIDNEESRIEQFKAIFDNLEFDNCISSINSNKISANESFFSNYLSLRMRNQFTNNSLEYSYLARFNNDIKNFINVFEYQVLNHCLCSEKLDNKKLELLNEVLDFEELAKIQLDIINMKN